VRASPRRPRPSPGTPAPRAYLFFGVITGFRDLFDWVRDRVVTEFGELHPRGESPIYPFPATRTYEDSMGPKLERRFLVLGEPWPEDGLAAVKLAALAIEDEVARAGHHPVERPVNIDPGLINDCRIILATTKDYAHRIFRGSGVWEEITLFYADGAYRTHPWTYPDFRSPRYHEFFLPFREEILEIRTGRPRGRGPSPPPRA
jgi:hypothetical protein